MATFADPNGNGTATAWTNTWTNVDEGVRQPSTPDGAVLTSATDEASETLVFTDPTYVSGATYRLWVYSSSGAKRGLDVAYSVNGTDPGTAHASRAELHGASAGAAWRSRTLTIASQTELNALRVQLICNATAGGGGAGSVSVDAVYVEIALPPVTGTAAQTLPALSQDAAGTATVEGTAAGALPNMAQAAAGTITDDSVSGTAAQTLPTLTQDAAATAGVEGAGASGLPAFGQDSIGGLHIEGPVASVLPPLSQDGAGALTVEAAVANTLPALAQDASGTSGDVVSGSIDQGLPALEQDSAGTVSEAGVSGQAASQLPGLGQDALVGLTVAGDVAGALGAIRALVGAELVDSSGLPTVREALLRQIYTAATVGAQIGIVSDQVKRLRAGLPVVVTREQLCQFSHRRIPANVAEHETWTLTGGNTLTP